MRILRRARLGLLVGAVAVVVLGLVVPVSATFADDELLRLSQLDPQLSPPSPEASCGSARAALGAGDEVEDRSSFYELARARACEEAGLRRVLGTGAGSGVMVMAALVIGRIPGLDRWIGRRRG